MHLGRRPIGISRSNDCCPRAPRRSTTHPPIVTKNLDRAPVQEHGEPGPPGTQGSACLSNNTFRAGRAQDFRSIRREIERNGLDLAKKRTGCTVRRLSLDVSHRTRPCHPRSSGRRWSRKLLRRGILPTDRPPREQGRRPRRGASSQERRLVPRGARSLRLVRLARARSDANSACLLDRSALQLLVATTTGVAVWAVENQATAGKRLPSGFVSPFNWLASETDALTA